MKMASRLGISVRSYYDYRNGTYCKRIQLRAANERIVSENFERFDKLYGAGRLRRELLSSDTPLSKTTVAKYMHQWGLKADLGVNIGFLSQTHTIRIQSLQSYLKDIYRTLTHRSVSSQ